MDNRANYRKIPTYVPDLFDPRKHTWDQIQQATCQAESDHEKIAVLSFVTNVLS